MAVLQARLARKQGEHETMSYGHGCGSYGYGRRYLTKEEIAESLGEYEKELELELKAVKERRADLLKKA